MFQFNLTLLPSNSVDIILIPEYSREYSSINHCILHSTVRNIFFCPASPENEDQRAAGSPAALTQLALCLRFALLI